MGVKTRIAIGVAALVWLALALVAGQAISSTPLKIYSIAGTIATITFLLWEKFAWRWKIIRYFTGLPLLNGTWRGQVISFHESHGSRIAPIPALLYISQTASRVTVTLFTSESQSVSEHAKVIPEEDGRWRLSWQYVNTPRPAVRESSQRHLGAAEVYIGSLSGEGLEGSYFTDRKTNGELAFREWSPRRYSSIDSGLSGDDFEPAAPFLREQ